MAKIFISYAHRNARTANKLASRLRKEGHYPWIDSEQILVGESIADTVGRAIRECDFLCFLVTKAFLASKWTRKEVNTALSREIGSGGTVVLPLLADISLKPSQLPPFLGEKRCADFRKSFDRGFRQLIRTVEGRRGHSSGPIVDSTVAFRTLMQDAIKIIRRKFPNYRIQSVRDDSARCIKDWFHCSGEPGWCEAFWQFTLRKKTEKLPGPSEVTAEFNPIWDILMEGFPGVSEIMVFPIPIQKGKGHRRIPLRNIRCTALDADIVIFDKR